jgi:hypothetical protein
VCLFCRLLIERLALVTVLKIGEMMQSGTKEHELLKGGSFRHRLVQNFF